MFRFVLRNDFTSPKDVALRRAKTKQILEKELKDLGKNDEISQVHIDLIYIIIGK